MTYAKAQERITREKAQYLEALAAGMDRHEASFKIGRSLHTVWKWRRTDPEFMANMDKWSGRKAKQAEGERVVIEMNRESPDPGGLGAFRWDYFGFPTAYPDQAAVTEALEDFTNQVVIILAPPGAGKDTLAGQYIMWRTTPDRKGLRAAWIMESENFSRRRFGERLAPYLTNPRVYERAPVGPGTQQPTKSLIDDFGPFKWQADYMWDNGEPVARNTWTKNEMYFLRVTVPEADPNLWATGISGALYGARIDEMVMSDVFTRNNQKFAHTMEEQMGWVNGDAMSRLDEGGRLVVLGTRIKKKDNYGRMLEQFVGDSPVVYENGSYRKHQNGVATVIFPAIQIDEDGKEFSYWEDRFPLKSKLRLKDGREFIIDDLGEELYAKLSKQDGSTRIRGLQEIRKRMGPQFETVYQQNPPRDNVGEFNDMVLARADDEARALKVLVPGEQLVLGVDPARTGGAGWILGGVDVDRQTITVIDFFWGTKLGTAGIKNQLIINPIVQYMPLWMAYEVNRESALLDDREVQDVLKGSGTSVHRHRTHQYNRGDSDAGVPVLSTLMRNGTLRFPAMNVDDRKAMELVKTHFRNFDDDPIENRRSQGKRAQHDPDDLALACWIMVVKARELLRAGRKQSGIRRLRGPVPRSIQRQRQRFEKATVGLRESKEQQRFFPEDMPDPDDLLALFYYRGVPE